jgi:hypothetical protein
MMTVILPVGPIEHVCIGTVNFDFCADSPWLRAPANYAAICYDGGIINTA